MDAAVEWSYRQCTRQEQRTWEQLSVFSGGFTADAAEAVCATLDDDSSVLRALTGLIDKSIIVRVNDRGPFKPGVALDLSSGAARAIGMRSTQSVTMSRC